MSVVFKLFFLLVFLAVSRGANILGVFTTQSPSHLIIHMTYITALLERGHNVTIVTTLPIQERDIHLNHVFIPPSAEAKQAMEELKSSMVKPGNPLKYIDNMSKMFSTFGRSSFEAIKDSRVQDIIHNPEYKFDLMILGYVMNEYELGIAAHMKCPIIISWPAASNLLIERYIGNPPEISYVPAVPFMPPGDPLKFTGRLWNFFLFGATKLFEVYIDLNVRSTYKTLFPAPDYPPLSEIVRRVSLVFCNSHFSEGIVRPNVPAIVDVGGIQIKEKPDTLSENLRQIVDAASEFGIIYVSFGSNLGSKQIDSDLIQKIYNVLSDFKQTILWKWDGNQTTGNATNIYFEKWLPQDDLLAHPNMKLFITHAGKGSVAESQYHGVPMVAIPMYAEQPSNAKKLVEKGFGLKVDPSTMTTDDFRSAVLEVLLNPKYKDNVKRFSMLYRDRPMTARKTAIFWIEYVIRHKGAYHMQSPLVHLNGVQYLDIDVMGFLLVAAYVIFKLLKVFVRPIRRVLNSKMQKVKKL